MVQLSRYIFRPILRSQQKRRIFFAETELRPKFPSAVNRKERKQGHSRKAFFWLSSGYILIEILKMPGKGEDFFPQPGDAITPFTEFFPVPLDSFRNLTT